MGFHHSFHGDFMGICPLVMIFPFKTSMSVKRGPPMATFDYGTATKTKRLQFARLGVGFEAAFQTMFIPISACLKIGYRQIECF